MKSLAILAAVYLLCSCATVKGSGGRFQLWEDKAEDGSGCEVLAGFKGVRVKCKY